MSGVCLHAVAAADAAQGFLRQTIFSSLELETEFFSTHLSTHESATNRPS
jgi:hypothetical protein